MAPINLPDGSQVSEIVLPDGSTASEVLAPDGSTVFGVIPDSQNLQARWPIDDNEATVTDIKGNNDGTNNGGTWQTESTLDQNYVLELLTDDYIGAPYDVGGLQNFTVAILVNLNTVNSTTRQYFVAAEGSSRSERPFDYRANNTGEVQFRINNSAVTAAYSDADLTAGAWELHSATFEGGTEIRSYLDGSRKIATSTSISNLDTAPTGAAPWYIGNSQAGPNRGPDGLVAQCLTWDSALTDSDHSELSNILLP